MSLETYVKMVSKRRPKGMPCTYCPINIDKHEITLGLSLIGFYPKGAKVVGSFNEDTEKLTLYKKGETMSQYPTCQRCGQKHKQPREHSGANPWKYCYSLSELKTTGEK